MTAVWQVFSPHHKQLIRLYNGGEADTDAHVEIFFDLGPLPSQTEVVSRSAVPRAWILTFVDSLLLSTTGVHSTRMIMDTSFWKESMNGVSLSRPTTILSSMEPTSRTSRLNFPFVFHLQYLFHYSLCPYFISLSSLALFHFSDSEFSS